MALQGYIFNCYKCEHCLTRKSKEEKYRCRLFCKRSFVEKRTSASGRFYETTYSRCRDVYKRMPCVFAPEEKTEVPKPTNPVVSRFAILDI
jgi:hypothetical protein